MFLYTLRFRNTRTMVTRTPFCSFLLSLLFTLFSLMLSCTESMAEDSPFDVGQFAVGHRQLELNVRGRDLLTDVWYPVELAAVGGEPASYRPILSVDFAFPSAVAFDSPVAAEGQHPVLVYYHGSGVVASSHASVHERLASHGFVVVGPNGDTGSTELIDQILVNSESPESPLFNLIDPKRIGAFGASLGGQNTLQIATRDERIKAALPITAGVNSNRPSVPTLLLTGSNDRNRGINFSRFSRLETTPRYYAEIEGAFHTSWGIVCDNLDYAKANSAPNSVIRLYQNLAVGACSESAIPNQQAVDLTNFLAVSFFKIHLNGDPEYGEFLSQEVIEAQRLPMDFIAEQLAPTPLQAGDSDQDLDFDQLDLVQVQIAAKYLTGDPATWGEGDWNGAPGGSRGDPPSGDGLFNQMDIIAANLAGVYLQGPYATINTGGEIADGQTSLVYNAVTGELAVDAPVGQELTSINVTSAASWFLGEKPSVLDGGFDNFATDNLFKATFGGSFGSISFGNVLAPALPEVDLAADLSAVGSRAGGGDLGGVDLVYIPEPAGALLLLCGVLGVSLIRRR